MCDSLAMRRLLGFLLALLLAIPAGMPHAQAAPQAPIAHAMAGHEMTMHHGHHRGTPSPSRIVHHDCLGCIAPIDIRLYRPVVTPLRVASAEDRPADMAYLLASPSAPEPPPPRAFV